MKLSKQLGISLLALAAVAFALAAWLGYWNLSSPCSAQAPPGTKVGNATPVSLAELRKCDEQGVPLLIDQMVTVEGVALIDTGKWHNAANYFAIAGPAESTSLVDWARGDISRERLLGALVYLPGTTVPHVSAGDLVQVTGKVSIKGYTTDYGTTVIMPSSSEPVNPTDSVGIMLAQPNPGLSQELGARVRDV
jgi:hypothetical protein